MTCACFVLATMGTFNIRRACAPTPKTPTRRRLARTRTAEPTPAGSSRSPCGRLHAFKMHDCTGCPPLQATICRPSPQGFDSAKLHRRGGWNYEQVLARRYTTCVAACSPARLRLTLHVVRAFVTPFEDACAQAVSPSHVLPRGRGRCAEAGRVRAELSTTGRAYRAHVGRQGRLHRTRRRAVNVAARSNTSACLSEGVRWANSASSAVRPSPFSFRYASKTTRV